MAAQKGKDLLLKADSTGAGVYTTIAGLRSRTFTLNAESIDITHSESAGQWRELLSGGGVRTARISGSGVFKNAASDATARDYLFNGTIRNWQIVVPTFGTIEGPFQVTSLDYNGKHDSEIAFDMTLESAGALTFTAG